MGVPMATAAQSVSAPHEQDVLAAVRSFLDYDAGIPLHAEVVARDRAFGFVREKVVLTSGRRDRVPGLLSLPSGPGPHPLVVLLHAGAGTKETWWVEGGLERGGLLTQRLLEAGYAVFALDGEHHGERAGNADFVPIRTWYFENEWWATFRDMVAETVTDYRRALDYLSTRDELAVSDVGAAGVSMGGITAVALAASDPRIQSVVTTSAALSPEWLFPLTHVNLSPGLDGRRVLTLVGDQDELVDVGVARSFHDLIDSSEKDLHVFGGGHRPPAEWASLAGSWLVNR